MLSLLHFFALYYHTIDGHTVPDVDRQFVVFMSVDQCCNGVMHGVHVVQLSDKRVSLE